MSGIVTENAPSEWFLVEPESEGLFLRFPSNDLQRRFALRLAFQAPKGIHGRRNATRARHGLNSGICHALPRMMQQHERRMEVFGQLADNGHLGILASENVVLPFTAAFD